MNIKLFAVIALAISVTTIACKANKQTTNNNSNRRNGPMSVDQVFKEMDANGDNKLSKDEVKGPIANDFDSIDTNDDGYITKTELEAAPKPENNRGGGQRGGGGMR